MHVHRINLISVEKDLKDLELVKRGYSTEFVTEMAIQFGGILHEV